MFETWKALFVVNHNHVMGTRTGLEMENGEGEEGREEEEDGEKEEDGEESGSELRKCCPVM
jgi:hypothetical protein